MLTKSEEPRKIQGSHQDYTGLCSAELFRYLNIYVQNNHYTDILFKLLSSTLEVVMGEVLCCFLI